MRTSLVNKDMDDALPIGEIKVALRMRICPQCDGRAAAVDSPAPAARPCEEECLLFVQAPRLAALVEQAAGEPVCGYGEVVGRLLRDDDERASQLERRGLGDFGVEALATIEQFVSRRG
jgi:hypothetical protein